MEVTGDINFDDIIVDRATITLTDLYVSGSTETVGITTLASNGGITTTGGDLFVGGLLHGVISGLSSEGNFVGTGATVLDFKFTSGNNITDLTINSGIATLPSNQVYHSDLQSHSLKLINTLNELKQWQKHFQIL